MVAYTPAKTKNSTEEALKAIWQELTDIRRQQDASSSQVQRLQRYANLDEKEFAVGQLQSERAILNTVSELARAVSALTMQQVPEEIKVREAGEAVWKSHKIHRQKEVHRSANHLRYMVHCKQEPTMMCPCGEHAGIRFTDEHSKNPDGSMRIVAENVCPRDWYVSLSRLAFEEGNLSEFLKQNKLGDYLARYKL